MRISYERLNRLWQNTYGEDITSLDEPGSSTYYALLTKNKPVAYAEIQENDDEYEPIAPLKAAILIWIESHAPGAGKQVIRELQRHYQYLEGEAFGLEGSAAMEAAGFRLVGERPHFYYPLYIWVSPNISTTMQKRVENYIKDRIQS